METTTIRWLLGTSILVDLLRGFPAARDWIDSIPQPERAISVITAAELLAGCRNKLFRQRCSGTGVSAE